MPRRKFSDDDLRALAADGFTARRMAERFGVTRCAVYFRLAKAGVRARPGRGSVPDLAGRRFGRLTAVRVVGVKARHRLWECLCDCGRTATVSRVSLTRGFTKSCGCLRREATAARNRARPAARR